MQNSLLNGCADLFQRAHRPAGGAGADGAAPAAVNKAALMRGACFGIAVLVCQSAWAAPVVPTTHAHRHAASTDAQHAAQTSHATPKQTAARTANHLKVQVGYEVPADAGMGMSPMAQRVSQIADQNGERRFLLIDKAHGRIILFENGKPILNRGALTGESMNDQLPPDATSKTVHQQVGVKYKVTPAGRFTVTRGDGGSLGETYDINEIQGPDWDIAIHAVWLGAPAEHRAARLASANDQDKHITYGCIDVDADTMRQLLRLMGNGSGTPVYILPNDESMTLRLFRGRDSAYRGQSPAG
jgi:hypothetical protein